MALAALSGAGVGLASVFASSGLALALASSTVGLSIVKGEVVEIEGETEGVDTDRSSKRQKSDHRGKAFANTGWLHDRMEDASLTCIRVADNRRTFDIASHHHLSSTPPLIIIEYAVCGLCAIPYPPTHYIYRRLLGSLAVYIYIHIFVQRDIYHVSTPSSRSRYS